MHTLPNPKLTVIMQNSNNVLTRMKLTPRAHAPEGSPAPSQPCPAQASPTLRLLPGLSCCWVQGNPQSAFGSLGCKNPYIFSANFGSV